MISWLVLGLEEHTLSTGYRGCWGWRGGMTHVGSVTLPCSALLERTSSLRPPTSGSQVGLATARHLRRTGDQRGEWWAFRPCVLLPMASLPAAMSTRGSSSPTLL